MIQCICIDWNCVERVGVVGCVCITVTGSQTIVYRYMAGWLDGWMEGRKGLGKFVTQDNYSVKASSLSLSLILVLGVVESKERERGPLIVSK